CTLVEGVKGKRSVQWGLVDAVYPTSRFKEAVDDHARKLAALSDRPAPAAPGEAAPGQAAAAPCLLTPLEPDISEQVLSYEYVAVTLDHAHRVASLVV